MKTYSEQRLLYLLQY